MNALPQITPAQARLPRCLTHGSRKAGWVYCIRDDAVDAVKIGFTLSPERRFRQLQTASSTPLRMVGYILNVRAFEQFLHWSHRERRLSGEWFDDADKNISTVFRMMMEGET